MSLSVSELLPKPVPTAKSSKPTLAQARRIAAFAVAARSLDVPLLGLSCDRASLSDVIGHGHLPHVVLIASLAGEMTVARFSNGVRYKDILNCKSVKKVDRIHRLFCRDVFKSSWDVHLHEHTCSLLQEAYTKMVDDLIDQNLEVLDALTRNLVSGLSLTGREAEVMLDSMRGVAISVTNRMETCFSW